MDCFIEHRTKTKTQLNYIFLNKNIRAFVIPHNHDRK